MTSGEQNAGGRTCLMAGEVDPTGQAQACVEPTQSVVVQPPIQSIDLPRVGVSDTIFSALMWAIAVVVLYHIISKRNRKK